MTLLIERLVPVPDRVCAGVGWLQIGQDALWFALSMLAKVGLAALVYGGVIRVRDHLGIGLSEVRWLPSAVAVVLAILLADLLRYWSHRFRHAVPLLWRFHAQERLNPLTEHRVHPVDLLVHLSVFGFTFAVLDLSWPVMGAVTAVGMLHTRLYHSSIRSDYGPLRHVLVTPQSHRIHHSRAPEHHDTNFGTMFSVWDRLFGTAHTDVASYPPVGIGDPTFPRGTATPARSLPRVVAAQLIHPFMAGPRAASTPGTAGQASRGGSSPTSAP